MRLAGALTRGGAALGACLLSGCGAWDANLVELPAPAPPGVVGVMFPAAASSWRPFDFKGVYRGTGVLVGDDVLLVTDHQNPFTDGPVAPETLEHPLFVPVFLSWRWAAGSPGWMGLRLISADPGTGAYSATQIAVEKRRIPSSGRAFKGELDLGWSLLRLHPAPLGGRVRIDFERSLRPGQEVYILRPAQYREEETRGEPSPLPVVSLNKFLEMQREHMARLSEQQVRFHAWRGRVVERPEGPTRDFDPDSSWLHRTGFVYFGYEEDMAGASGGPVLIHEDGEWIAVGIYTGSVNYDNLFLVRYHYGVFVRPDLAGIGLTGE